MESGKKKEKPFLLSSPSLLSKQSSMRTGTLSKRLKLYTDEDHHTNSLSIETLTNRIINLSKDYLWRSYEILYHLPILVSTSSKANYDKKNLETFLYFFYSVAQSTGYGVLVQIKANEIEFKHSWNFMDIKNIKYGNEINEIILTVDEAAAPLSYRTMSSIDRDEIVWILIQICQYLCDHNIKAKSFETKHLIAAIAAKDTFNKFPLLKKLLEENMDDDLIDPFSSTGESILSFTPEESDAEKLFDEFQWGNTTTTGMGNPGTGATMEGNSDPAILQKKLKTESELLHIEICDFLLQWEDDDLIDHSIAMGEWKSQQERVKASTVSGGKGNDGRSSSSRETLEMLTILAQVDQELILVDDWLTKQINYLSSVQRELFQIEAENSTLETSWHNLSAVKTMITALLDGPLSLASDHEVDLRNPVAIVRAALEDKELKNTQSILLRLVNALGSLRNGLLLIEGNDPSFNPAQWERLQSMSVIAHQRNKLIELSDLVCNSLTDLVGNLFKSLLQHKALTDQNIPKNRSIVVRKFSFSTVTNRVKEQQGRYLVVNEDDVDDTDTVTPELGIPTAGSTSVAYGTLTNQLLNAQQVYHNAILPFLPLLENLSALSPSLSQLLSTSYIEATESYLYCPLTKEMFRELFNSIPSRSYPVFTLASAPKSLAKRMTNPTLRFQHPSMCRSGTPLIVSPWTVLAISIKLIEEVVSHEKAFLTDILKKLNVVKKSANAAQDYLASTMGRLFEQFREKILRLVTQTEYSDGVELIPMLITTEMLFGNHHNTTVVSTSASLLSQGPGSPPSAITTMKAIKEEDTSQPQPSGSESSYEVDLVGSLLGACKSILQDRLNEFVSNQIAWINQCKEDPKKSIVLLPFAKFPAFVDQIKELAGDKVLLPSVSVSSLLPSPPSLHSLPSPHRDFNVLMKPSRRWARSSWPGCRSSPLKMRNIATLS
jgi:hypothetical protein